MNAGTFPEVIIGLLVLLIAPILFGASVASKRRFALAVFATWSAIIFWGIYASYARYSQFAPSAVLNQTLLQTPVQYAFNIVALLLLPALPFFLLTRLLATSRRSLLRRSA